MPDATMRADGVLIQLFDLEVCRLDNKKPYQNGRVGFPEWKGSFDSKNRYCAHGPFGVSGVPCLAVPSPYTGLPGQPVSGIRNLVYWLFLIRILRSIVSPEKGGADDPGRVLFRIVSDESHPSQRVVRIDVQRMSRGTQAGDAVNVVVETPRAPDGGETLLSVHAHDVREL